MYKRTLNENSRWKINPSNGLSPRQAKWDGELRPASDCFLSSRGKRITKTQAKELGAHKAWAIVNFSVAGGKPSTRGQGHEHCEVLDATKLIREMGTGQRGEGLLAGSEYEVSGHEGSLF